MTLPWLVITLPQRLPVIGTCAVVAMPFLIFPFCLGENMLSSIPCQVYSFSKSYFICNLYVYHMPG